MNREPFKTIIKGDRKLVIEYDDSAESPDSWGDDNLYLTHDHRQFAVRDKEARQVYEYLCNQRERDEDEDRDTSYDNYWIFSVAAYIHSGVHLSLGSGSHYPDARWDVSHVGFVLASKEEWSDEDKARKCAEGLIETWNEYLGGEVYGYSTFKKIEYIKEYKDGRKNEECIEWEYKDSCWGFYGDSGIEQILSETGFKEEEPVNSI